MYGTGTVQSIALEGEEKITYVMFDAKDVIKVCAFYDHPHSLPEPHTSQLTRNPHSHTTSLALAPAHTQSPPCELPQNLGILAPLSELSLGSCFILPTDTEMDFASTREVLFTLLPTPPTLMQQPAQPVRLAAHTHASYTMSQVSKAHAVPGRLYGHNHVLVHTPGGEHLSGQVQLPLLPILRTLLTLYPHPAPSLTHNR